MPIDRITPQPASSSPVPRMLLVALGHPLRHDDGVASSVLSLVSPRAGVDRRIIVQPPPDMAMELRRYDDVVFVDTDTLAEQASVEPLVMRPAPGVPIGHSLRPGEVVTLARYAYGFTGRAWLCRVPVRASETGVEDGEEAQAHVRAAAEALHEAFPASLGYAGSPS